MANKKIYKDDMTVITVSIPVSLNRSLKKKAEKLGVSKSQIIQSSIYDSLKEDVEAQLALLKNKFTMQKEKEKPISLANNIMDEVFEDEEYKKVIKDKIKRLGVLDTVDVLEPKILKAIKKECLRHDIIYKKYKARFSQVIGKRLLQFEEKIKSDKD